MTIVRKTKLKMKQTINITVERQMNLTERGQFKRVVKDKLENLVK